MLWLRYCSQYGATAVQSLCQKRDKERYLVSAVDVKGNFLLGYFKIVSTPGFKVQTHQAPFWLTCFSGWKVRYHIPKPNIMCISPCCLSRCQRQPFGACLCFSGCHVLACFGCNFYPSACRYQLWRTALAWPCRANSPSRIWPFVTHLFWAVSLWYWPWHIKAAFRDLDLVLRPTKRFCSCCNPSPSLISAQLLHAKAASSNM